MFQDVSVSVKAWIPRPGREVMMAGAIMGLCTLIRVDRLIILVPATVLGIARRERDSGCCGDSRLLVVSGSGIVA